MKNLPTPINCDNDLEKYRRILDDRITENNFCNTQICKKHTEQRLNNMSYIPTDNNTIPSQLKNTAFMPAFLSKHIGKLIKVEALIGDRLETRIGVLLTVGASYIVLKQLSGNNSMICDIFCIKFITIIHDNDPKKLV